MAKKRDREEKAFLVKQTNKKQKTNDNKQHLQNCITKIQLVKMSKTEEVARVARESVNRNENEGAASGHCSGPCGPVKDFYLYAKCTER